MSEKKGVLRLLEIADEKRSLLIVSAILSSLSAICMLVPYASVYFILQELLLHASSVADADGAYMIRWGVIALFGLVGSLILMYAGGMVSHIAAFRILYGLRVKLASHIGRLPLGWLSGTSTGAVKKTLEQNVEKVETFIAHQLPDLVQVVVTIVVMVGVMFYLNVWLALACVVPIVLALLVQVLSFQGTRTKENIKKYYDSLERMNGSAVQYVRGMPAIKVFGQTVHSFRQFYADMISYRDYCVKHTRDFQNGYLTFKVILGSFVAFILPVGVFLLSSDPHNVAFASVLLFFLVMAPGVSAPMFKIMFLTSTLRDIGEGVERMDRIFAEQPVAEPLASKQPQHFDVAFDDVSFAYASATATEGTEGAQAQQGKEALSHVSFLARHGQVTALVGPSGAGKSTVANLIPRFWDVQEGAIRIGDMDIRDLSSTDLMNTVAFVFQETFLFYDTVYNNIAVGLPDAAPEAVYAAAKAAQCHQFILNLPQGYDTLIGEGGVYLSGGEEQRVAVARAILKNAPILVLDEATAFADPENEYEMQLALAELVKGKTVIVIAHRLSTIREADQILVMQGGKLVEQGKHEALLQQNGLYARMWSAYTDAQNWQIGKERGRLAADEHVKQYNSR
ncbi:MULTISPECIES: ABC transporter ATP-binding protein [Brevibacillus]|uniref:ABC transporter ATP-binding protein n=1 Tax=Brevibacillus TaxID=55080 RepID=UPI000EEBC034|nr:MULTISPECIES: ABC transporter ATP-binding protein [Brevibacillus]MDR4999291.1 ABC transporter ATP-binding protein [Brevibacillus parabrevis]NRQ56691.1 ABC transporter ATP-binding protein [Brevibacillus sp. HD1.4A]HBZ80386.1 ABC transporter ATP-binding protein [Brevibacillus sp.]